MERVTWKFTLPYVKQIVNGNLLYGSGNSNRGSVLTQRGGMGRQMGGRLKREGIYVYLGKGNGTPLQYSCLENPMDGGAWQAAVHGVAESYPTERLHFHFSLSSTGEGNGNPLQCSCLENPKDGGAQWAAVCGVTQSRTRLKRLSSSSSSSTVLMYSSFYLSPYKLHSFLK